MRFMRSSSGFKRKNEQALDLKTKKLPFAYDPRNHIKASITSNVANWSARRYPMKGGFMGFFYEYKNAPWAIHNNI